MSHHSNFTGNELKTLFKKSYTPETDIGGKLGNRLVPDKDLSNKKHQVYLDKQTE